MTSSSSSSSPILPEEELLEAPSDDLLLSASLEGFADDECDPNRFDFKADRAISVNGLNAFKVPPLKYCSPDLFGLFC